MTAWLVDLFAQHAARPPDGVWAAPGRVNLIGEHTDYNDGFVLPIALALRTRVALAVRRDRIVRCWSTSRHQVVERRLDDKPPGRVRGWGAYPLGVAWALREQGVDVPGFDLLVGSDVPSGAGLSSSAALECAVALALDEVTGADLDRTDLALAGQRAENDVVGAPTGIMDQVASLYGAPGAAVLLDCRSLQIETVPLGLVQAGLRILVVDTRTAHAHAKGEYGDRRRACERAAQVLGVLALRDATAEQVDAAASVLGDVGHRRARHIVTENVRVRQTVELLRSGHVSDLGPLLDASHASLRDDFEVSCAELDLAVSAAREAGALGARMTGGGFGGSVIALVAAGDHEHVRTGVAAAFARAGYREPHVFDVEPAGGAQRLL